MVELTFDVVDELIRLDPLSGRPYWRLRERKWFATERAWKTWNSRLAGKEALTGRNGKGYRVGRILDVPVKAHRVVWLLHTGGWPEGQIDHINGQKDDNRPENLRDVSSSENQRNACKRKDNASGVTGISWDKRSGKWLSHIRVNESRKHLGYFSNLKEAIGARKSAERLYGFHQNHGRAA